MGICCQLKCQRNPNLKSIDIYTQCVYNPSMIQTSLYLTKGQQEALEKEKVRTGLSKSELIRRAIDQFLAALEKERKG